MPVTYAQKNLLSRIYRIVSLEFFFFFWLQVAIILLVHITVQ